MSISGEVQVCGPGTRGKYERRTVTNVSLFPGGAVEVTLVDPGTTKETKIRMPTDVVQRIVLTALGNEKAEVQRRVE